MTVSLFSPYLYCRSATLADCAAVLQYRSESPGPPDCFQQLSPPPVIKEKLHRFHSVFVVKTLKLRVHDLDWWGVCWCFHWWAFWIGWKRNLPLFLCLFSISEVNISAESDCLLRTMSLFCLSYWLFLPLTISSSFSISSPLSHTYTPERAPAGLIMDQQ